MTGAIGLACFVSLILPRPLGYYFARHLEDNGFKGKVVDVNVGEAATDREHRSAK